MADPQTPNLGAYQPTTGSDVGTWGSPINANAGVQDSLSSNVAVIPLSSTPVTLTTPPATGTAWAGPYQSQSGVLRFTGTLTSAVTVTLPRAGFWIVENLCTVGAFYVALASLAPGQIICAPPGESTHIYCDGINVKYVDFVRIGSYVDFGLTAVPAWIANCTVPPYLNCDGSTFNGTTYPVLASYLGGTTLPDLRGRVRAALNQTTGRITTAVSGINGDVLLSAGGDQNVQAHTHTAASVVTDPGHVHGISLYSGGGGQLSTLAQGIVGGVAVGPTAGSTNLAGTGISVATTNTAYGAGTAQNMPPTTIAGLTLIRAG